MMMPSRLDCRLKEWKLPESEAIVKSNLSQSYVYGRMAMELNKVVINERTQKVTIFGLGKIFFIFFVKSLWIRVLIVGSISLFQVKF